MTSNAPQQCCTVGVRHEGTAKGEVKKFGDYQAYVAYPEDKSTENAVLVLTDVIGHEFINAQLIADQFAANGYFTVMPDLFHGDPVPLNRPEGYDIMKWMQGPPGHMPPVTDPILTSTIQTMRSQHSVRKLGAVGYCFGGKYVARFMGSVGVAANATIDAGFTAHPSFIDEAELRAINGPFSIAAAETDPIFGADKRHETEVILKEMAQSDKKTAYQINLYANVEHGFACRADIKDKRAKFAKEQAFLQAVTWFDYWLKGEK